MSVQENKALARRVFDEVWSQGKLDLADEILTPDFVGRPGSMGEPFKGPAGAKEFIGRLREAFPDITFTVEDMVAEGDRVATRWTATGFYGTSLIVGALQGLPDCEATALSNLILRRDDQIGCPVFTPIDAWEARLKS